MRSFILLAFSLTIGLFVLLASGPAVFAQGVNDFVINSFHADYSIDNSDPQGKLTTTEEIELNFAGQNHGILRAIPQKYGDVDTNPKIDSVSRDGVDEHYITYEENDNLVVKIGKADVYITGEHKYSITYSVENVITFYDNYDEIYWDVNGNQWAQYFDSVSLDFKAKTGISEPAPKCYTGVYLSEEKNCEVSTESYGFMISTTEPLGPQETLTFVAVFKKGYFTPLTWWEQYGRVVIGIVPVSFMFVMIRKAYKKWKKYGKDYKSRGITVPYFGRPRNVSVMQAAYVATNSLAPKYITASLIDLAIRGYIRITETNDKKPKHELEIIKAMNHLVTPDESKLLRDLFGTLAVGNKVKLEDKKHKMSKTLVDLRKMVDDSTNKKGFYDVSPLGKNKLFGQVVGYGFVGVILGFVSSIFLGGLGVFLGFATLITTIVFGALMSKRSLQGERLKEHMEGLELYLSKAEKDRLAAHDAVAAPLSTNKSQPVRNVKFFEKLLPFAVVYGVEKTWAKAFSDIYTEQPDWYQGNMSTFSTAALASSIAQTSTATAVAFTAPTSSSGGSGFSGGGGGFSGGGGGGGGGGGW